MMSEISTWIQFEKGNDGEKKGKKEFEIYG